MRQKREYPKEFKLEAVRRYLNNGRRVQEIAKELGIPSSTLRTWKDKYMKELKNTKQEKTSKKDYEALLKEKEKRRTRF